MAFILKSVFCLTMVFLLLPEAEANRVKSDVTRAIAQDRTMQVIKDRTAIVADKAMRDAERMCVKNSDQCLDTAKRIVRSATNSF